MSRKKFNNRLESLFSDLEPNFPSRQIATDQSLPGWTWECDPQGKLIACSPDIEEVLGFLPEDIVGQELTNFALPPDSVSALQEALKNNEYPINLDMQYKTRDGNLIPVSMHIFEISTQGQRRLGGFALALFVSRSDRSMAQSNQTITRRLDGSTPWKKGRRQPFKIGRDFEALVEEREKQNGEHEAGQVDGAKELPDEPQQPNHVLASEKVKEILEAIQRNSNEIAEFEFSQIITNHQEEFKEDRSKRPTITGSLAGMEIRSYPKIIVHAIEHRLEWGNKLRLAPEEIEYIESHKFARSGLSSFLQRRSAPREIIKQDKFWISVCVMVEKGKLKNIQLNYDKGQNGSDSVDPDNFLQNPKIILPKLMKALKKPWHSQIKLRSGEDYLIPR